MDLLKSTKVFGEALKLVNSHKSLTFTQQSLLAIKKLSAGVLSDSRRKDFEREISALMKLRPHQNLVSLMGVSLHNNDVCIITEYCAGGTLFDWLHEKKNFVITWKQKVKMAMDIACGMNYLHTCNPPIMHRDLKSLKYFIELKSLLIEIVCYWMDH